MLEPKLTSVDSVYSQADEVPCASNPSIAKVEKGGSLRLKARNSSLSVEFWLRKEPVFFFFLLFSHLY